MPEREVERQQTTIVVESDVDLLDLPALVCARDEVLTAILDPLHLAGDTGLAEASSGPRDHDFFGPRVNDLDAESAADVRSDAVNLVQRHPQSRGDCGAGGRGRLGGGPEREGVLVTVPTCVDALALHRHGSRTLDFEIQRQSVRRGGQFGIQISEPVLQVSGDVVRNVGVDGVGGGASDVDPHYRLQRLVGDVDLRASVLGDVPVVGDHHGDGFSDMLHLVLREGIPVARSDDSRMRNEQWQVLRHFRRVREEIFVGVDGMYARHFQRLIDVDVDDSRMGVRRPDECRDQRVVAQIVEVSPLPAEQTRIFLARNRFAEELAVVGNRMIGRRMIGSGMLRPVALCWFDRSTHALPARPPTGFVVPRTLRSNASRVDASSIPSGNCPARSRLISAARRTDALMFWYPVQRQRFPAIASVASSRVGLGFSSRNAAMVVTNPGVQNPHCRP